MQRFRPHRDSGKSQQRDFIELVVSVFCFPLLALLRYFLQLIRFSHFVATCPGGVGRKSGSKSSLIKNSRMSRGCLCWLLRLHENYPPPHCQKVPSCILPIRKRCLAMSASFKHLDYLPLDYGDRRQPLPDASSGEHSAPVVAAAFKDLSFCPFPAASDRFCLLCLLMQQISTSSLPLAFRGRMPAVGLQAVDQADAPEDKDHNPFKRGVGRFVVTLAAHSIFYTDLSSNPEHERKAGSDKPEGPKKYLYNVNVDLRPKHTPPYQTIG